MYPVSYNNVITCLLALVTSKLTGTRVAEFGKPLLNAMQEYKLPVTGDRSASW